MRFIIILVLLLLILLSMVPRAINKIAPTRFERVETITWRDDRVQKHEFYYLIDGKYKLRWIF